MDDEDEVLLALADELGNFVHYVGGAAHATAQVRPGLGTGSQCGDQKPGVELKKSLFSGLINLPLTCVLLALLWRRPVRAADETRRGLNPTAQQTHYASGRDIHVS